MKLLKMEPVGGGQFKATFDVGTFELEVTPYEKFCGVQGPHKFWDELHKIETVPESQALISEIVRQSGVTCQAAL